MRNLLVALSLLTVFVFPSHAWSSNEPEQPNAADERWGLDIGLGGTWGTSEYKGVERGTTPLPALGYDSKYVYFRGTSAGIHLFRNDMHEINVQISYLSQSFYSDWSENDRMKKLDDRYPSMAGGISYLLKTPFGIGQATISSDLLGISNGIFASACWSLPILLDWLIIVPSIGVQWTDINYNNYYYGIDKWQAHKSGLEEYDPDSAISPFGGLTMKINFAENWNIFANGSVRFLGTEIRNSPMVDTDTKFSFSFGVLYGF